MTELIKLLLELIRTMYPIAKDLYAAKMKKAPRDVEDRKGKAS